MTGIPFDSDGLLLRRHAIRVGLNDNWLSRMVRGGVLVRIRHGAYVERKTWNTLPLRDQHSLRARAVMRQYDDRVALSHVSAHLARGGPDYGLDLSTVHVTNLFGRGDRTQAGITHHHGLVRAGDVSRLNGHWVTAPGRTCVETAALARLVPAVCVFDWTLNQGLVTIEELTSYVDDYMLEWPGTIALPRTLGRCDGRSQSVGETRIRLILEDLGFRCEPQWEVRQPSGRLIGIVDLWLPDVGVMVEFDGKVKYGRLLKPGQTIADVIEAERRREIGLHEVTRQQMVRLVWPDLDRPEEIEHRIYQAAARRAG